MLRKLDSIEVDAQDPFKNDKLDRKQAAENLTLLLGTLCQPFVISVNGSWGSGKTTFVKMWKQMLEIERHICFYFNAWEHDFSEDPLVAIVAEIQAGITERELRIKDGGAAAKCWQSVKKVSASLIRNVGPIALRVSTQGALDARQLNKLSDQGVGEGIGEYIQDQASKRIDAHLKARNSLESFKKNLTEFATEALSDSDCKSPIVFFVDELDRCKPSFAISFLERLKHLFSVPNLVFVLSVDREQLAHTVRACYGNGINADGYLRRFIDHEWALPVGRDEQKTDQLSDSLIERIGLKSHLEAAKRHADLADIRWAFSSWVRWFGFSIRIQEQCMSQIFLAIRITPNNMKYYPIGLVNLIMLRALNPILFCSYRRGTIGAADVVKELDKIRRGAEDRMWDAVEYHLTIWSSKPGERDAAVREWHRIRNDDGVDENQKKKVARFSEMFQNDTFHGLSDSLNYVLNKIEFFAKLKIET